MKGCLRKCRKVGRVHNKTNFNDWSDPKYQSVKIKPTDLRQRKSTDVNEEELEETPDPVSSQTSLEIEHLRSRIKKGYALLTKKEIRNIKLPFYESLLLNVKEDGYIGTYEFINDLILLDEEYHALHKKDHSVKDRPFLKLDNNALDFLCKGLIEAEKSRKSSDPTKEIKSLLTLAMHFSRIESSWSWLAEELFVQCVCYENSYNVDLSLQAIAKHLYAKFLLFKKFDLQHSKLYVEASMKLSEGKHWCASEITGEKCDLLYFESCILLHKILLEMANNVKDNNSEIAIQLCRNALHLAKTVNDKSAEASALVRLVSVYLYNEILTPVLDLIENYLKICLELGDVHGTCEGYLLKVTYYELMEDDELVVDSIQGLLKIANEHKITNMLAIAHRNLATSYLMQGKEKEMQEHAIKAYNYYVQLNMLHETEETRCLTGIAQAQEIMSHYLRMVLEAEDSNTSELNCLIDWKMLHIPFVENMQLYHPEAKVNEDLKLRIEKMKGEEQVERHLTRLDEMKSTASTFNINKFPTRRIRPSGSFSSVSTSRSNYQKPTKNVSNVRTGSLISSKYSMSLNQ